MFVEKPWASSSSHAKMLADICHQYNATVMVGFSFRYHPTIVKLRHLMDSELGAGWMLNGEYVFDFLPPAERWLWDPENGNGLFNENSCHLFDAVCYLMGKPISVMAEAVNFVGRPSEEAAAISIKFESGAIAALTVGGYGANAHWDFPRIDVTTAHGQARLKGRHHMWESLTWATRDDDIVHTMTQPPEILGTTRYTHALTEFVNCIRDGRQPSATIKDGEIAVALAEAVYTSARSGKKVTLE
jgi:myo-inositol 2-dehydrogenase/D-chiro-inositol 1-dehydrogenase